MITIFEVDKWTFLFYLLGILSMLLKSLKQPLINFLKYLIVPEIAIQCFNYIIVIKTKTYLLFFSLLPLSNF